MPTRRTRRSLFRLGLPLCGWCSLALFVLAASGLPIPVPFAKDLSRAFPCMFDRCGCQNAEQCWRSCCCHTVAERLAWADAHHIDPPAELIASAQAECRDASCDAKAARSCCASDQKSQVVRRSGAVSLVAAMRCRGVQEFVAGVPITLPPPRADWRPSRDFSVSTLTFSCSVSSWVEPPPVPPPRSVAG